MFQNLKHKNPRESDWKDMPEDQYSGLTNHCRVPNANSSVTKTNEGSRMVRCRHCGFPCDKERDSKAKEGSWAGFGINQGEQLNAGTSVGDRRVPASGVIATTVDQYYDRVITAGCPCCGSLVYDI